MNCINHPETPAAAFCRTCGKALCVACEHAAQGTVYCAEHFALVAAAPPGPTGGTPYPGPFPGTAYTAPPPPGNPGYSPYTAPVGTVPPPSAGDVGASPGLAFLLGLIPGVGAIYNGQYVKGLVHVVILGVLISIINSDAASGFEPLFGMLTGAWVFYMAFEAYHTARKRQLGERVDEFSSIVPLHGRPSTFPVGPVILIAAGLLFLLNTMDVIRFHQLIRYWPVALIVLGAYMLYERVSASSAPALPPNGMPEASREHR
ncbi:MAG: B-box zinc finger protein [Acidobacteriota bacterium]|nr:B-box zinc finger protein [Acidobacteriota bacterium]